MSEINIVKGDKVVGTINNNIKELNKHIVIVEVEYIDKLKSANIPFTQFQEDFYLVKRGKKPKKYNQAQVEYIKKDLLENKISVRKAAEKYKCSPSIILQIKNNNY